VNIWLDLGNAIREHGSVRVLLGGYCVVELGAYVKIVQIAIYTCFIESKFFVPFEVIFLTSIFTYSKVTISFG